MILTLTPNPSIDATVVLTEDLVPGAVHRATSVTRVAGGKGVNVSHAAVLAQEETVAMFPARGDDPFLELIKADHIPSHAVAMPDFCRTNTTVTQPGGVTTKLNGPGPTLSDDAKARLTQDLIEHAATADWVVMAGSLPQGVTAEWYSHLISHVRAAHPDVRIAVDTSDAPLRALVDALPKGAPDLLTPNAVELGQIVGTDGAELEAAAAAGDYSGLVAAGQQLNSRGVDRVLVTLGAAGAILVSNTGAWAATPPDVDTVLSTVGAGDSSLAGFVLADCRGAAPDVALQQAVAFGTAAVQLPGTTIPALCDVDVSLPRVVRLDG